VVVAVIPPNTAILQLFHVAAGVKAAVLAGNTSAALFLRPASGVSYSWASGLPLLSGIVHALLEMLLARLGHIGVKVSWIAQCGHDGANGLAAGVAPRRSPAPFQGAITTVMERTPLSERHPLV